MKTKLKKGDLVQIIAGAHKSNSGPIIWISKDRTRVSVEGVNVVKHQKPNNNDTEGGIKRIPATIHISNVMLVDPKKKETPTKIGIEIKNGTKTRVAKKSQTVIK